MNRFLKSALCVIAACWISAAPLQAAVVFWTGASGDLFEDPLKWTPNLPIAGDSPSICNGTAVSLTNPFGPVVATVYLGYNDAATVATTMAVKPTWAPARRGRRLALLDDLEQLENADMLLSFESIGRLALHDPEPKIRASAIRLLLDYETVDLIPEVKVIVHREGEVPAGLTTTAVPEEKAE